MSNQQNSEAQPSIPETPAETGATFALAADDPRRTENRGGLEAAYPMTPDVPTVAEALAGEHAADNDATDNNSSA